MPARPILIRTRIGSALSQSFSRESHGSDNFRLSESEGSMPASASGSAATSAGNTPATTNYEFSPGCTPDPSRPSSPTPATTLPSFPGLERASTSSSNLASSFLSRLTFSSPRSTSFEVYKTEKRKRERKEQKNVDKKIKDFHNVITGAVFIGTVIHYLPSTFEEGASGSVMTTASRPTPRGNVYRVGVCNIEPRDPPPPRSSKAEHYSSFTRFYNEGCSGDPLQCFFDVFMKSVPREGARVSFIVTPTGEDGDYVAVACNILDKHAPVHFKLEPSKSSSEMSKHKN